MQKIRVLSGESGYDIVLDAGLHKRFGTALAAELQPRRALLVTDERLYSLFGRGVAQSIEGSGVQLTTITIPAGGHSGTLETLKRISSQLKQLEFTAEDALIMLGGGVLCDMGGYAAANYTGRVRLVQCPTTLLAMTDWAVHGRTAVEHKAGKKMLGSFFIPDLVLIDPETVFEQSDEDFSSGMGEVIKCAFSLDSPLFGMLESLASRAEVEARIEEIVYYCLSDKAALHTPQERIRATMGHSLAHAIEAEQRYRGLKHGQAVAVGLIKTARYAERFGYASRGVGDRLAGCLVSFGLPLDAEVDEERIHRILKSMGDVDEAIPQRTGTCAVRRFTNRQLLEAWFDEPRDQQA